MVAMVVGFFDYLHKRKCTGSFFLLCNFFTDQHKH
jgi:hypothetical protein